MLRGQYKCEEGASLGRIKGHDMCLDPRRRDIYGVLHHKSHHGMFIGTYMPHGRDSVVVCGAHFRSTGY